jgi:hypothetical protein
MSQFDLCGADGRVLFTFSELACKGTHVVRLARGFGRALIDLRQDFGKPMRVNSCCRSRDHNRVERGHPNSLHVYDHPHHPTGGTCAIDIHTPDNEYAWKLARIAMERGWSVGRGKTFVHLDRRRDFDLPDGFFTY